MTDLFLLLFQVLTETIAVEGFDKNADDLNKNIEAGLGFIDADVDVIPGMSTDADFAPRPSGRKRYGKPV